MTLFVSEEFSLVEYGVCCSEDYEMNHRSVGIFRQEVLYHVVQLPGKSVLKQCSN
jgi:hypothetical protein